MTFSARSRERPVTQLMMAAEAQSDSIQTTLCVGASPFNHCDFTRVRRLITSSPTGKSKPGSNWVSPS